MIHTSEDGESLWILTFSPAIWAIHFILSYITGALWCGMVVGRDGPLWIPRIVIAILTALALGGIGITGWIGYRKHESGSATVPHDFDTPEDRTRFLGFATLLLSGLSAVATIYVALVVVLIGSCV